MLVGITSLKLCKDGECNTCKVVKPQNNFSVGKQQPCPVLKRERQYHTKLNKTLGSQI